MPDQKRWLYILCWTLSRIYFAVWHRLKIVRNGKLPEEGPVLIISNHASTLDPPLVSMAFRNRMLNFMGKAELFESKFLGWLIDGLGTFPVKRGGADRQAYVTSVKILKEGKVLLLFPEGTRTTDGEIGEFQEGAARIALSTEGVRILPVRLRGSFEAFGPGRQFPKPVRINLHVGEAFAPEEIGLPKDKRALYQALTREMQRRISEL